MDAIITRMRQQSADEPNLLKIIRSPEVRDKLKAIMTEGQVGRFNRVLDLEEAMFHTSVEARGGSQTARRQAAMQEQDEQLRALRDLDAILELALAPTRWVFLRGVPAIPRAARERLLARQNEIITRRLLNADHGELPAVLEMVPPRPPGGRGIAPAIVGIEGLTRPEPGQYHQPPGRRTPIQSSDFPGMDE